MNRHYIFIFSLLLVSGPVMSQTALAPEPEAAADKVEPDKIVILGQRPGPGLWKISRGDHVLWVFGTYSPLPKKMEWRSKQVEAILSQSQEYLPPPVVTAEVGFFQSITLLPFAIGFKNNPDGAMLKDVVPPDMYARWLVLKEKYIGENDDVERERPIFAANELYAKALDHVDLASGRSVGREIEKIVKKDGVKTTPSQVHMTIESPVRLLKEFKKSSLDDLNCFATTLTRLETDIDAMRARANAWAKGDLEGIIKLGYTDQEDACETAVTSSSILKGEAGFESMASRKRVAWIANAEKSLASNASTFAVLPIKEILDTNGGVMALQAKGYIVEKPE